MHQAKILFLLILVFGLLLLAGFSIWFEDQYLLFSFVFVLIALLPFYIRFERKQLHARELVLIAMLASLAAVSRVPFAAIPSVQPTTFVIIITALVFGAETGFMVGATAALVSNLFLGQGPWTPWQMFSWGLIGFLAGLWKDSWWMSQSWGRLVYGFMVGFLFGWIMNLSFIFSFVRDFSWPALAAAYASSVLFDFLHALSNVFFLLVFADRWIRVLQRFKRKYGLLEVK